MRGITTKRKKIILFVLSFVMILESLNLLASDKGQVSMVADTKVIEGREDSYEAYKDRYKNVPRPTKEIEVPVIEYIKADEQTQIISNFNGVSKAVETQEQGTIEWEINVQQEGLYNILIEYYPIEGRSSQIERKIEINGELPFFDASHILFSRVWSNEKLIEKDNRDNELRPRQVEKPNWEKSFFKDAMGYYIEPYAFYFKEGKNTIKLISIREPLVIKSIKLCPIQEVKSYEEVKKEYEIKGYSEVKGQNIKIQGEHAQYKSDPTLYPLSDRSSPATEPYHHAKIRMNMIGEEQWKLPGQWIEWEIEVPESGLYEIALKQRQNALRGSYSNRRLTIDGEIPFKEVETIPFKYQKEWSISSLGGEEPYLFYLTEGKHRIRLEVTLGELGSSLNIVENSIYELNTAYRNILMLTGAQPDLYRDYQIDKKLPEVLQSMKAQSQILFEIIDQLTTYTGKKGSEVASIQRLAYQLSDMVEDPDSIAERLGQFKDNVASLGTWVLSMREQPLAIDYLIIKASDVQIEEVKVSFINKIVHEIKAFIASFIEDYNTIGNEFSGERILDVWVTTGRDQAQIIKAMIDESFTSETGIGVNVRLVDGGVLLPATVSGNGPDIAMQVPMSDPVNYAIRNAVADLTQFKDYKEVEQRFNQSAIVPYRFNDGVYALPETQEFPMLFYRKDILEELELEVPRTWEEVIDMLPTVQKNHMNFAIPIATRSSSVSITSTTNTSGLPSYAMLLYQRGGELYSEDGARSIIDSSEGVEAFEAWTELFVNYKLPLEYDFANRFRTGEIPIGITSYSMYNRLSVFAPEIRGLWEFVPIPGIERENGVINRSVPGTGISTIMLEACEDKNAAWEYMKWWTSADTQVRFGREMESLMGAAARYPTANKEALSLLPWPINDYESLMTQWEWVRGNPEVPGGYFTPRHIDNAFRKVVYEKEDPRETILDYVRVINEELQKKRLEFGLPIAMKERNTR